MEYDYTWRVSLVVGREQPVKLMIPRIPEGASPSRATN